jgi:hypothetical protein
MENLTPEGLRQILLDLQGANLDAVVVGGQAVNLWAYQYLQQAPELSQYLPFASEDLDFYGGRVEAMLCQDVLGGKLKLNRDFDPSPNAGVLLVDCDGKQLRIDVLASVFGLNDAEVVGTALTFSGKRLLEGVQIKVLHPILCLEGKLRCLRGLPQYGRQDLKHAAMSVLCVRELLKSICNSEDPRLGLKPIERVLDLNLREDGLSAWYRHQLQVELAIPIDFLRLLSHPKWQKFCSLRFPQWMEQIAQKRDRYLTIMNRLQDINSGN